MVIRSIYRATIVLVSMIVVQPVVAAVGESSVSSSVVRVNSYRDTVAVGRSTGFVVATQGQTSFVVTSGIRDGLGTHTVSRIGSDDSTAELLAMPVANDGSNDNSNDKNAGLTLLRVNGLASRALGFSLDPASVGDTVWMIGLQKGALKIASGNLLETTNDPDSGRRQLNHTAVFDGKSDVTSATLILNECVEIVGIGVGSPQPDVDASSLLRFLAAQDVQIDKSEGTCVSAISQAQEDVRRTSNEAILTQKEADRMQQVARDLEQQLLNSSDRSESTVLRSQQARSRADESSRIARQAQQQAEQSRAALEQTTVSLLGETQAMLRALEQERKAATARDGSSGQAEQGDFQTRELLLVGLSVFLTAGIIFCILLLRGKRNSQRSRPAAGQAPRGLTEPHQHNLAEYVLDGRDEDGIRYLLRMSGDKLARSDGVTIGRNPQDSPYIINHADVSRQHARMKVMKNRIFIEDLGSTNGTSVNGQAIESKGLVAVNNNDQIIIGSVVMKLRVLND